MTTAEPDRAKRFKVYRNGDEKFVGKPFVLNKRQCRTYDSFLNALTNELKAAEAVRRVCTPVGGTQVQSLDGLEHDAAYVAVGIGRFKKLGYINILP